MSYSYSMERPKLFTEDGQRQFLKVRDLAHKLLEQAGAVSSGKLFVVGDAWLSLACMDRLIELGELREITGPNVAGQCRVFVRVQHHD